jgi:hypothetical protein
MNHDDDASQCYGCIGGLALSLLVWAVFVAVGWCIVGCIVGLVGWCLFAPKGPGGTPELRPNRLRDANPDAIEGANSFGIRDLGLRPDAISPKENSTGDTP